MSSEREDERLVLSLLSRGMWMGAVLGAVSAFLDMGPLLWLPYLVLGNHHVSMQTLDISLGFALIRMPFGAIVGWVIGTFAGIVAGAYAINTRRRRQPQQVARGIRTCIMVDITAFVFLAALIASGQRASNSAFGFFVVLPGATALLLGWLGSSRMSAAYLRREAKAGKL